MKQEPLWLKNLPVAAIKEAAGAAGVPPDLLTAIVQQESGGRLYCQRFEPGWRYFLDIPGFAKKLGISIPTETMAQACSYGLTQIMGSVARELGFNGHLGELFDPKINLQYGAKHLRKFIQQYPTIEDAIASYNAGSPRRSDGKYVNQSYVDSALAFMRELNGSS